MVTAKIIRLIIISFILGLFHLSILASDISPTQAWAKYINNELIIIDVRTKSEWKETGVIPNSILISMHDDDGNEKSNFTEEVLLIINKVKDKDISFICASGGRSNIISSYLSAKGYEKIYNISQGFFW